MTSFVYPILKAVGPNSGTAAMLSSPTRFFTAPIRIMSTAGATTTTTNGDPAALTQLVLRYHRQTKHALTRYARGPSALDWANQPNPFRRYPPAPVLPLLHPATTTPSPPYTSLFSAAPSLPSASLTHSAISCLFYDSLSLSAWKSTGYSTWSLRVNPSSGNLHPTESYIISPPVADISGSGFVAHYAPKEHALELRAGVDEGFFRRLGLPAGAFLVGFASVLWREAWKYGERGFRYCNHDVGHAVAAVAVAAAALGWDARLLDGLGFEDLERLMGLGKGIESDDLERKLEREHPDCVLLVMPSSAVDFPVDYSAMSSVIAELSVADWSGELNLLSEEHVNWEIVYKTAHAAKKPLMPSEKFIVPQFTQIPASSSSCYKNLTVREVVRKRRSAVDMDGVYVMEKETFYQLLLRCLPLAFPFKVLPWDAEVHCALFVHRVKELPKGLYFLVRNVEHLEQLRQATRSGFEWEKPDGCPSVLPLYRLAEVDCQLLAKRLSCHQDIASEGCFSLGMIARFEPTLREKGAWMYPRLFWESGVLGQVLYLEAHAVGISATGIGCYFDDSVHEVLGLQDENFQSLYHFTVGSPVLDRRIMSLPAYPGPNVDA